MKFQSIIFLCRGLFVGLIVTGAYFVVWSDVGILRYQQSKQELMIDESRLAVLNTKVVGLKQKIFDWKSDDFNVEKVARENLGLARKNEIIYIL